MTSTCPYCRTAFADDDEIATCSDCGTQHHADCVHENRGCTVFGCSQSPVEEPKISVSNQDLAPASAGQATPQSVPSFLNLSGPWPQPEESQQHPPAPPATTTVTPTPPPPRIAGAPPPRPFGELHTDHAPAMTYPTFAGYAAPPPQIHSYTPRKSRVVFVLLALFLGAFGGHNFYAGYVKKGVIQLCLTLFSCFFAALVSWVWAIVEACTISSDHDGIAFV